MNSLLRTLLAFQFNSKVFDNNKFLYDIDKIIIVLIQIEFNL